MAYYFSERNEKFMQNKVLKCITAVVLVIMVVSLGMVLTASSGAGDVTEIRVAFNQNEKHPQYLAMRELGDKFEAATNGRYKMTIYANGILGAQNDMAEFIRTGALQMAIVPSSVPEGYDKDFAIVGCPYMYDGMDHMEKVVTGGVFDNLFESTRKYSFQVLTVYTAGERNVYAKKPINSAADLKGMIIRVNSSPTYIKMTELMGGQGAAMAQSEVYTALQQGVIDAAENSELVFRDFKHYEVSPYYVYTKHIVHPDVVIASNQFLDSMTPEDRAIFDKLVVESAQTEFATFRANIEEAKKEITEKGTQFCYPDVEEFRTLCQPLLDSVSSQSDVTKDIYNKIVAMREE